jgi:hypothetical protein
LPYRPSLPNRSPIAYQKPKYQTNGFIIDHQSFIVKKKNSPEALWGIFIMHPPLICWLYQSVERWSGQQLDRWHDGFSAQRKGKSTGISRHQVLWRARWNKQQKVNGGGFLPTGNNGINND